jgi:ribonucleoside-diphosphate reductase beta chain
LTRKFFVYTKPDCPHCTRAKALLESKSVPFLTKSLETSAERQAILDQIKGWKTFPVILEIDPVSHKPITFIGGADALEQMLAGG